VKCNHCRRQYKFVSCPECYSAQGVQVRVPTRCNLCRLALRPWELPETSFAAVMALVQTRNSAIAVLGPLLVSDGAGWAPSIGSHGNLYLFSDRIEVGSPGALSIVSFDSLRDIRVGGQSVTTGGGFLGGGFGAKGAAEGMLVGAALNKLTTKKQKWVTISIVSDGGWVDLRLDNYDVLPVKKALRVLADRVIANQNSDQSDAIPDSVADSQDDLVRKLERLAALRGSGALSEEEFAAAKVRLLQA
jgi:hypothetical protein